jgi:hypothetical protein
MSRRVLVPFGFAAQGRGCGQCPHLRLIYRNVVNDSRRPKFHWARCGLAAASGGSASKKRNRKQPRCVRSAVDSIMRDSVQLGHPAPAPSLVTPWGALSLKQFRVSRDVYRACELQ